MPCFMGDLQKKKIMVGKTANNIDKVYKILYKITFIIFLSTNVSIGLTLFKTNLYYQNLV